MTGSSPDTRLRPIVLDLDGAVGPLPGERRLALAGRHDALRFACGTRVLAEFATWLREALGASRGPAFLGSGDFHHLTLALLVRHAAAVDLVVLDNHPDNMRFPVGVHCGSWVRHAARLAQVRRVDVVGIASADASGRHGWEHYREPLRSGRLTYWCIGADTRWAARAGLAQQVRSFESTADMLEAFALAQSRRSTPVHVSIDKDVLSAEVARTNWDQGVLDERDLLVALGTLHGRVAGADVTGGVSRARYRGLLKRMLVALDRQPEVDERQLGVWQAEHHALDLRLLAVLRKLYA